MYKKVLAYLALTLGIAEVGVVLVSWLLTAAMPESFTHSPLAPCHSAECRRNPLSGSIHAESHSVHLFFGCGDEHELWHHEREHQGHLSGL